MKDALVELRNLLGAAPRVGWERKSIGFDKEQQYLELMLNHVVVGDPETGHKRSNSVIVYGPPGSGKTSFIESTLGKLSRDPDGEFYKCKVVVRLNGMLCPDFRSSIEEICWQLNFHDFIGDVDSTLGEDFETPANFDDRLEQTMAFLKTKIENLNKSIIFVLDKLELFAEQPNQGLLYNLFDIAANHHSSINICIIGVTTRVDVLELFEKRVKSRFSHRQINLVGGYDFDKYKAIAQQMLCVKNNDEWNSHIATLFEKIEISRILHSIFDTDKTIRQLSSFLFSVCLIADDKLTLSNFQHVFDSNFACSNHVKTVLDLSISELLVLLSIYKQMRSNKQQAWQPGRLYRIVEKIIASVGLRKDDYLRAVLKLEAFELIVPVSISQRNIGGAKNVGEMFFKCELTIQEFQDIWKSYPQLPSSFQELL